MKKIEVLKGFVLHLADGSIREFKKGVHDVEEFVASHWYTLVHSCPVEDVEKVADDAKDAHPVAEAEKAAEKVADEAADSVGKAVEDSAPVQDVEKVAEKLDADLTKGKTSKAKK